ncbi:hypothetical protein CYMTET_10749 [Cymbomonas tetramitiformis]|uniref:non-specific serine/threonine protein kinase n=1 Tax=Cymbomonas tetramitiformis TaxID=36881 RepID=A0AAE0GQ34_9CHLO|nr:hypothetical protein CYMTET_10749 [Cymbomonas tetramitiformis]
MATRRSCKDDFVIGKVLGRGSFGVVYKCLRKEDKETYVIKEIDMGAMNNREQQEALNEVKILASVNNKYIVKYYDSFIAGRKLHIVMEFAENGCLHDHLKAQRGKTLPEREIWKFLIQIVLGLFHLHGKHILHRDIKTLNIFLDRNNSALLGDLGVSKVLSTQTNFAKTLVGTPYYLSPELCEGKPYNNKSDVWALGVCLYECCTLRHPFSADNQGALFMKILRGKLDYGLIKGYSNDLVHIIKLCLSHNASRRPDCKALLTMSSFRKAAQDLSIELPAR